MFDSWFRVTDACLPFDVINFFLPSSYSSMKFLSRSKPFWYEIHAHIVLIHDSLTVAIVGGVTCGDLTNYGLGRRAHFPQYVLRRSQLKP